MAELVSTTALKELTTFLECLQIQGPIALDSGTTIVDFRGFVSSHLTLLAPGNSLTVQRPALDRILLLLDYLEKSGIAPDLNGLNV